MFTLKKQEPFVKKVKFEKNPGTKKYSVFIPFAGDYQNMMDVLKALNIPNEG